MATIKYDAIEWTDEQLEVSDPQLAVVTDRAAEQSQTVDAKLPGETSLGLDTYIWGDAAAVVWVSANYQ